MYVELEYLTLRKDRAKLHPLPSPERSLRLLIFQSSGSLTFRLAAASTFDWSSAVLIDLAMRAARESAL